MKNANFVKKAQSLKIFKFLQFYLLPLAHFPDSKGQMKF